MEKIVQLSKGENENNDQYIWRLCQAKDSGQIDVDWFDLATIFNEEIFHDDTEKYLGEAAYRKPYQQAKRFYESGVFNDFDENEYIEKMNTAKEELKKERQKLSDERNALYRKLREQGRKESFIDLVKKAIDEHTEPHFKYHECNIPESDCDAIIHLTDIHCGADINSTLNTFNNDILNERLSNYLNSIRDIVKLYHPENAYLILGGDLIHGLIHLNSRIESKENVIEQVMYVTDFIGGFIDELSTMFKNVNVYTTMGNHSRIFPDLEAEVKGENFDILIPYILKKDLKNIKNVHFIDNKLDCEIATFMVRGHMVYAAHGDKDTPQNVVYNMTKFARKAHLPLPDMCYLGHRHTNGLTTVDDVKVIESGCVDGMDSYAINKRLTSRPEQTVTIVTEDNMIKALCDIQID